MGDPAGEIKDIARNLLCIEVNTIVKPMMTGRKMPEPRHALIDIAEWYETTLNDLLEKLRAKGTEIPDLNGLTDRDGLPYHKRFDTIRDAAYKILPYGKELPDEDEIMLLRIKRMSDQIKGIIEALAQREHQKDPNIYLFSRKNGGEDRNDPETTPTETITTLNLIADELVLIRKIWELGVEVIVMQTVVQLDGDVVTRIRPDCADEKFKALHAIHNQTVTTSVHFWGQLIGVLVNFFTELIKNLFLSRK
jgi:hypothetical protein